MRLLRWSLIIFCLFYSLDTLVASDLIKKQILKAQKVLVIKSKRRLYLLRNGRIYQEFPIALGGNPIGAKRELNDQKTPEGHYILDSKNIYSHFYRSIHISYPTSVQKHRAREKGVSAGGDIMIHGSPNGWEWIPYIWNHFDWTSGCIALSNSDMRELWNAVNIGTPIEIEP